MPRTVDEGFRDFLTNLTPSRAESQAAKNHRASIEACLKSNFGLERLFRIGSFGNGTSIYGYSDVDYLACLPTNKLTKVSTSSLEKVRRALDARFPASSVTVRCPAVVVPFGSEIEETTEIVPGDFRHESNGYSVYDIADSAGGWLNTSPDAHNAYVHAINQRFNGKVKALIRFVKAWKYFKHVPISSFYLELRVAKYAYEEKSILYSWDVKRVLCWLRDIELADMQDPMGISGLISPCKTQLFYENAMSKLGTAASRAEKALECEKEENIKDAFYWWRLLYDEQFPAYYR